MQTTRDGRRHPGGEARAERDREAARADAAVTIKVRRIGNGYEIKEMRDGVPFAYPHIGAPLARAADDCPVNLIEHIVDFFARVEEERNADNRAG